MTQHASPHKGKGRPRPSDWPEEGPIDLKIHDLPHASSELEWWYVNCHLETAAHRPFSLFAAFFRFDFGELDREGHQRFMHNLAWALVDVQTGRYLSYTLLDPSIHDYLLREIDKEGVVKDPKIKKALREMLLKGAIPLPDRLLSEGAKVRQDTLSLDYAGNRFYKDGAHTYILELGDAVSQSGCRLSFVPEKPLIRHGENGINAVGTEAEKFYYFFSKCEVQGEVTVDGHTFSIQNGSGWYDHEFGYGRGSSHDKRDSALAWNWLSAQLDNGWELTLFEITDRKKNEEIENRLLLIDPAGVRQECSAFTFVPLETWKGTKTFEEYPITWKLQVPACDLSLDIKSTLPNQEIITLMTFPSFWEGRVALSGTWGGHAIQGLGFIERTGFSKIEQTEDFFEQVDQEVIHQLDSLFPAEPVEQQAVRLVAAPLYRRDLEGMDVSQFWSSVVLPIREMVRRGGKAWRSYALLASIDAVGGNSEPFKHWLTIPELLHVGSLILDDVEDHSEIRRGGVSCHKIYGEPLAINAGCACYFFAQLPLLFDPLTDAQKLYIYEQYFQAMRGAHAGQGLDIRGLNYLIDEVVESGNGQLLEQKLWAIHRLKSGVSPAALGRAAAFVGGANPAQLQAVGDLLQSFGVAFQIMDDVLNIEGFERSSKVKAEDLSEGKITIPVAKAMSLLPLAERRELWRLIASKTKDLSSIRFMVDLIEKCGALTLCRKDATDLVQGTWHQIDPIIPDSHVKLRLRTFSWFILERHY